MIGYTKKVTSNNCEIYYKIKEADMTYKPEEDEKNKLKERISFFVDAHCQLYPSILKMEIPFESNGRSHTLYLKIGSD